MTDLPKPGEHYWSDGSVSVYDGEVIPTTPRIRVLLVEYVEPGARLGREVVGMIGTQPYATDLRTFVQVWTRSV